MKISNQYELLAFRKLILIKRIIGHLKLLKSTGVALRLETMKVF